MRLVTLVELGTSIWLYHVMAFLITVIEAGLGAIWGGVDPRSEEAGSSYASQEKHNSIMLYGILVLAVALACVEGFFYSRYGNVETNEEVSLFGVTFTLMHALGFLGIALPLILFALGHFWHRCLGVMTEKAALNKLRKSLKVCRESTEALRGWLPKVQELLKAVQVQIGQSSEKLPHIREEADQEVVSAIRALQKAIEDLPNALRDKQGVLGGAMSDSEIWRQVRRVVALILLTLFMGGMSVWLGKETITVLFPDLSWELALLLGLVQVPLWLSVGVLVRPTERTVDEQKNIVGGPSPWGIAPALLAIVVLLGVNGYVLFQLAIPNGLGIVWGIMMGIQLVLLVLGSELPDMLGVARYFMSLLWIRVKWQLRYIGLTLLRVIEVCLRMLELALEFVTLPARWISQIVKRWKTQPPATV